MRDDFSQATKDQLAKRAGFRCSFGGCNAPTSGPSAESDSATANTGMAAHISAASPGKGTKRYDPTLTKAERASIKNGIWCCYLHGKLIDTDETLYSVELLKKWKELAERRAALAQSLATSDRQFASLRKIGLAPIVVQADGIGISRSIPLALKESCCDLIFGSDISRYLCDFLIEYSKNAAGHGKASQIQISFQGQVVEIRDDGGRFDARQLLINRTDRGGSTSFRLLLEKLRVDATHSIEDGQWSNCLSIPIAFTVEELKANSNCVLTIDLIARSSISAQWDQIETCQKIFLVFDGYLVYSDIPDVHRIISQLNVQEKQVVIVLPDATPEKVDAFSARCGVEVISLPAN